MCFQYPAQYGSGGSGGGGGGGGGGGSTFRSLGGDLNQSALLIRGAYNTQMPGTIVCPKLVVNRTVAALAIENTVCRLKKMTALTINSSCHLGIMSTTDEGSTSGLNRLMNIKDPQFSEMRKLIRCETNTIQRTGRLGSLYNERRYIPSWLLYQVRNKHIFNQLQLRDVFMVRIIYNTMHGTRTVHTHTHY